MSIIIVAFVAGALTWLVFRIMDQRKGAQTDSPVVQKKGSLPASDRDAGSISIPNENVFTDYSVYVMSKKERLGYILLAALFFFVIGIIFYQNAFISLLLSLLGFYFPKIRTKQIIEKRKQELSLQFKQSLYSLASSLGVGKSVENSFREVVKDLKLLYPNPNTFIIREFELINRRVENGETIEEALQDFAGRAHLEDIANFADVFTTCKRTGGDLIEVIRRTSNVIGDKLEIKQEISVMVAQKRFESKVIVVAPIIIVALLSMSSPDYMAPLYQLSTGGPIVMTIALFLLYVCYMVIQRIMNIKV